MVVVVLEYAEEEADSQDLEKDKEAEPLCVWNVSKQSERYLIECLNLEIDRSPEFPRSFLESHLDGATIVECFEAFDDYTE